MFTFRMLQPSRSAMVAAVAVKNYLGAAQLLEQAAKEEWKPFLEFV
jgi:hypothetical protein